MLNILNNLATQQQKIQRNIPTQKTHIWVSIITAAGSQHNSRKLGIECLERLVHPVNYIETLS